MSWTGGSVDHGRDAFNQNFRKFRSKTEWPWIGSVQPEKFRKKWSTFPGGHGPFHLTIPTHSQSQDLAVRYLPCTKWRKILIAALLWIVNSRSIGVTRISMYSYHRSVAASQAKCMWTSDRRLQGTLTDCWPQILKTAELYNTTQFFSF